MGEKDVHSFETKLWIPPKGQEAQGVWSADNETSLFQAAKAMLQPG